MANDSNPNDGMSYVDISQPEAAWKMVGKLLEQWRSFRPVQPISGKTVHEILVYDWPTPESPYSGS